MRDVGLDVPRSVCVLLDQEGEKGGFEGDGGKIHEPCIYHSMLTYHCFESMGAWVRFFA